MDTVEFVEINGGDHLCVKTQSEADLAKIWLHQKPGEPRSATEEGLWYPLHCDNFEFSLALGRKLPFFFIWESEIPLMDWNRASSHI